MNPGVFILVGALLVVVMIHEAGHFFVAKFFDFKATKFFLGFGPTIWSTTRGETEYGIKALPLGGFVKIVGMNPYEEIEPGDEDRVYGAKPRWQRALVIVAGSATHFVVAFVILLVVSMTMGFPTGEVTNEISGLTTELGDTATPASELGLEIGDRIVGINGRDETEWVAISDFIRAHPGEEVDFAIEDEDGGVRTASVRLGSAIFGPEGVREYAAETSELREAVGEEEVGGFLGVSPSLEFATTGFFGGVSQAADFTWLTTKGAVVGIGDVFGMVFG
ncbi:MAG: M50 family metallopeptidase, partial [Actinomycetota bacterium]